MAEIPDWAAAPGLRRELGIARNTLNAIRALYGLEPLSRPSAVTALADQDAAYIAFVRECEETLTLIRADHLEAGRACAAYNAQVLREPLEIVAQDDKCTYCGDPAVLLRFSVGLLCEDCANE